MDHSEMNSQPLSHDDAMALTGGSLPQDRPDLVALAAAIDDFRETFTKPAPQPSATLVGWMTGAPALPPHGVGTTVPVATPVHPRTGVLRRWTRTAAGTLTGLGLAAKIALGGTAALAAVTTAGAIGVLPEGPQGVFDRILDNNQTDTPPPAPPSTPATPPDDAGSGARHGHEHRLPIGDTSDPQDSGGPDKSQDVPSEPAPDMNTPTPEREEENHPETDDERPEDSDDDSSDASDQALSGQDSDDGPERSQDEDAEQTDGSDEDAVDMSSSGTDSHDGEDAEDAEDSDAATERGSAPGERVGAPPVTEGGSARVSPLDHSRTGRSLVR